MAKDKIRSACHAPFADIYFLSGGTQTNAVVIGSWLAPHEGVIAAETGHINVHEAGAIEFTGHKVLTLPHHEGKLDPDELEDWLIAFSLDPTTAHIVHPGMVYLSHPTEYGTLYTRKELTRISRICRGYGLHLYLDGARLGCGLMSPDTDVDLPFLAEVCNAFYIGGTKMGALCGEAVVFPADNAPYGFFTIMKQRGALMAKGRLCGVQFDALFTDDLYFKIGRHAVKMAMKLKKGLQAKGVPFLLDSPTNQQFIILENEQLKELQKEVRFTVWEPVDETHTAIRLATGWATEEESVDRLLALF